MNQKICLFVCECECVYMHRHMTARAITMDRASPLTGPLRTRSQRSCYWASISCINIHVMRCPVCMIFMQNVLRYWHREPLSWRASQEDSTEEPTAALDRCKRSYPCLYVYTECIRMLNSLMNAILMRVRMHPSLAHLHWPDQAGGSRHERTGRHTSTLTINTDPQSSVLHLEMSIPMPMAPMRALQKIWWTATEKIKNSSVGLRRYGAWDGRSPDAGAPLKPPGTSQTPLRLPPSEYRGCK